VASWINFSNFKFFKSIVSYWKTPFENVSRVSIPFVNCSTGYSIPLAHDYSGGHRQPSEKYFNFKIANKTPRNLSEGRQDALTLSSRPEDCQVSLKYFRESSPKPVCGLETES
jgi:hypothetical protein